MRQPNQSEHAIERSMLRPVLADFVTNVMLLVTGFVSGSLTLISEGIRSQIMLLASFYAVFILRAKHRGKLEHYQYGVDKIESFVSMVVGAALVVSGLWVSRSVIDTLINSEPTASPLGLTMSAIVNAINAVVNILGWWGMKSARPSAPSEVFQAQLSARFVMMASSIFLQVTLTIAALAKDPLVALAMDCLGAGFVATIMIYRGGGLLVRVLPHILDSMASSELQQRIRRTAERVVAPAPVARIRSRHAMDGAHAEIFVSASADLPSSTLLRWAEDIRGELKDLPVELRVDVVVEPETDAS